MSQANEYEKLSYAEAKRRALEATATTSLYGIPLDDAVTLDDHTAIVWCGIADDTFDERQVTNRVWHVPNDAILGRTPVDGFVDEGHQIYAFVVRRETVAIEEVYAPVRLDGMIGAASTLARFRGPRGTFGGLGGVFDDVPLTIDPNGSRPTQSPPLTIYP